MKSRALFVVIVAAVIAVVSVSITAIQERAEAQGALPELRSMILQGFVTINGELSPNGFQLTAKIRDNAGEVIYTSAPTTVGRTIDGRYTTLVVGPFAEGEGREVEFWLDDQVKSTNTTVFAPLLSGRPCVSCPWTLPILRPLALDFPVLPIATPTPTQTPSPTPVVLQPSLYGGQILAGSSVPPNGTTIFAKVGDYTSPLAVVNDGRYQLVVNPVLEKYQGVQVVFFIGEFSAAPTSEFVGGEFLDSFNLIFPNLPPTPTPTPIPPTATPTPEPTRTPTPVPSPTATATPTVTPTPIVQVTPTVEGTATPDPDDSGGGFCSAHAGGPSSVGMLGLLALPFGLLMARRLRSFEGRTSTRKEED